MSVTFTTLKNTNQEIVVKAVTGANSTGTLTIANLGATTQARNSDSPTVNIVKFMAVGELGSHIFVTRNSINVISSAPENAPFLDFNSNGFVDNQENTSDIVINNDSAKTATVYLILRKVAGWSTKVETATYGAYDDETAVGAKTISGSPGGVPSAN